MPQRKNFTRGEINITAANRQTAGAEGRTNNVKYKNIWKTRSRVFLWSHFWATPMKQKQTKVKTQAAIWAKEMFVLKICGSQSLPNSVWRSLREKREKTINLEPFLWFFFAERSEGAGNDWEEKQIIGMLNGDGAVVSDYISLFCMFRW